jgi:hypothetical protein
MLPEKVFLDTSYVIALCSYRDKYHHIALRMAEEIEKKSIHLITTQGILLEIGNALARQNTRNAAVELLESIENDPLIEIIPLTDTLYKKGLSLFRERMDKEWGLTDCISFITMKEHSIKEALTTDDHFHQAGFKALLLELYNK